ncbi:L,D-transpeptidase family protein [Stappia albiluteola]|uniref:L,D-transpeptidase family protein n=1 Tax=Stappia albiluteola TaxID=2758565 RepID=UPI0038B60E80
MTELLTVRRRPANKAQGLLTHGSITIPCAIGRGGPTARKREGDGATPLGQFELLKVYYRPDRLRKPVTRLPVEPMHPMLGWCDAPADPCYNQPVLLPFAGSHEKLWREDHLYDIVVVLDYNLFPPVDGKGSAIFFHLARPDYSPTEGCVAVSLAHMLKILASVGKETAMSIEAA